MEPREVLHQEKATIRLGRGLKTVVIKQRSLDLPLHQDLQIPFYSGDRVYRSPHFLELLVLLFLHLMRWGSTVCTVPG